MHTVAYLLRTPKDHSHPQAQTEIEIEVSIISYEGEWSTGMPATCWVSNLLQSTLEWFQNLDRVACLNFNSLGLQWQEHLAVDSFQSLCLPSRKEICEAMVLREVGIVANASSVNMMGSMKLSMFQNSHFWCDSKRLH